MNSRQSGYQITRHVCPRNCYDACGMLAYVRNGKLEKVSGDPAHGYTRGKLCAKGYGYVQKVYSPDRLQYPLRQIRRGSGRWQRISWDQALDIIAEKILTLKQQYRSTLPICLNKYSGNFGILHYAVEGLFNSIGPTTQANGSPCWSAGLDAQYYDMGGNINSDPQEMEKARLIVLWGGNPAWTAVHSLPYLYNARETGAKIVVIDPVYTQTAQKADLFFQIRPGEDGALALAIAKILVEQQQLDYEYLENHTVGWQQFIEYVQGIDLDELAHSCGQDKQAIELLARMIGGSKPVFFWIGFGLQRHNNGGQNIRAIDALGALTGNIGVTGGGVHYAQQQTWGFNMKFLHSAYANRYLNINRFVSELAAAKDPPVKMLWISCRNLLTQDALSRQLLSQLDKLDMIVTVEQFLTATARCSDIVLPTTSHFEELDVVPSYWHHWISVNEQAILPYFDAKSDLGISQMLAAKLNEISPGCCSFPGNKSPEDFLDGEFNDTLYSLLGIHHWSELRRGPRKANLAPVAWHDKRFATPSGKFEFVSPVAGALRRPFLAQYCPGRRPSGAYPFWLITSHAQQRLNSQFQELRCLDGEKGVAVVYLHPEAATAKGIKSGDMVRLFNAQGSIVMKAQVSNNLHPDTLLCYQGLASGSIGINALNSGLPSDMGEIRTGQMGLAVYDLFVDCEACK